MMLRQSNSEYPHEHYTNMYVKVYFITNFAILLQTLILQALLSKYENLSGFKCAVTRRIICLHCTQNIIKGTKYA